MVKIPKNKVVIALGVIVALLPLLGFPRAWESFFQVFIGASVVLLTIWATIDKKLTLKAKAQRRQAEKRRLRELALQAQEPQEENLTGEPPAQEEMV